MDAFLGHEAIPVDALDDAAAPVGALGDRLVAQAPVENGVVDASPAAALAIQGAVTEAPNEPGVEDGSVEAGAIDAVVPCIVFRRPRTSVTAPAGAGIAPPADPLEGDGHLSGTTQVMSPDPCPALGADAAPAAPPPSLSKAQADDSSSPDAPYCQAAADAFVSPEGRDDGVGLAPETGSAAGTEAPSDAPPALAIERIATLGSGEGGGVMTPASPPPRDYLIPPGDRSGDGIESVAASAPAAPHLVDLDAVARTNVAGDCVAQDASVQHEDEATARLRRLVREEIARVFAAMSENATANAPWPHA